MVDQVTSGSTTILLCDDEPLECLALQRIFAQAPYPIRIVGIAHDGNEAVSIAREKKPQIVFMDIRMPGMDGLEATKHIRALNSQTQIIILSAYDDFAYAQEALRLGAVDYVLKPAEPKVLYETLGRIIERIRREEIAREQREMLEHKLTEVMPALPVLEGEQQDAISQAIAYARTHYHKPLRLADVARAVSLSPGYLSRIFTDRTGTSFRRYLIWLRIEAAKLLLRDTMLTVGEIAERVGYMDGNHFSVRFKQEMGMSPHVYRLQERRKHIEKKDNSQ